jgi:hypothetical protein
MVEDTPFDAMLAGYGLCRQTVSVSLGVSREAVRKWALGKGQPSPKMAQRAQTLLGIPRWELRPDLWPRPKAKPKPEQKGKPKPIGPGLNDLAQDTPSTGRRTPPGRSASPSSAG